MTVRPCTGKCMSRLTKFRYSIPQGMTVYEDDVEVVGVGNPCRHARKFLKRSKRRIYLQREPGNTHEADAIKVMGRSKGWFREVRKCIGYVPSDIARRLVASGVDSRVMAKLHLVSIRDRDSIQIRINLLGPLSDYEKYAVKRDWQAPHA